MPAKAKRKQRQDATNLQLESLENRHLLAADLIAISPVADSTFVDPATNIVLTFDEPVSVGTGNITIKSGDAIVETIDVTDAAKVSIDGGVVTVNPASDLAAESNFSILVDAGAFGFQTVAIFSEDFEGVELIPFEVESDGNDEDTDWSEQLPAGWVKDNTDTPEGGPIEFFGMTIFDKESWIAAAGNQGRDSFTRGSGNVMVADPDEYDDIGDIGDDLFNVFLTTPEIALAEANATLEFNSSFRPYDDQTGLVDVSFDGGNTWENLLTLNNDTVEGGQSSLARANVKESLPLGNEGGANALVRFGMIDGGNDWWWAFDDVVVEVPGEGESFEGIEDPAFWSFSTAPGLSPAQNSSGVALDTNLSITFSKDVVVGPGQGDLEIRRAADDSVFEIIAMASSRVTASGATVTIDPVNDLEPNTEYYVVVDDFTIWDTEAVNVSGITLFSEDFEDLALANSGLVGGNDINNYVVVMSGVLDVQTAGEYTFGGNSDDGQLLAIDLAQDGLDLLDDEIIFDDNNHGNQDRLSTCAFEANDSITSCVGEGDPGFQLAIGQYAFEYWYFENGGGSSGEFFYAPGTLEEFVPGEFVLVGDDSKGIGVTADGITATTYLSAVEDAAIDTITDLGRAQLLIDGDIVRAEGFPATEVIPTADVWNTGGTGRFADNHPLPGFEPPEPDPDWSPVAPEGWTRDNTFLEENRPGGPPEYFGWTFFNKDFWVAQQGNQNRTDFELGENIVALVDPDAYDDFVNIDSDGGDSAATCEPLPPGARTAGGDCGYFAASLSTPAISLDGLDANAATLTFDSSWRDETTQSAELTVEFFDGNGESISTRRLLRWESMSGDANYKQAATNETVILPLENPANAASFVATFTMPYAQNDWWWAIDNIRVTSPFSGNPLPGIDAGDWSFTTGDGSGGDPNQNAKFGDANGDGTVDFSDFLILSTNFNQAVDPFTNGDSNGDGQVDFPDFLVLSTNFNQSVPAPALAASAADLVFAAATDPDDDEDDDVLGLLG